jgi:hypothetical protein
MNIDCHELFPEEISDEAAYHLIDIFYNLALIFEGLHLGKSMRYQKSLINNNANPDKPWESLSTEETDPPF